MEFWSNAMKCDEEGVTDKSVRQTHLLLIISDYPENSKHLRSAVQENTFFLQAFRCQLHPYRNLNLKYPVSQIDSIESVTGTNLLAAHQLKGNSENRGLKIATSDRPEQNHNG